MTTTYDPRTIALLSEIIYPPQELQPATVQAIHNELYQHKAFAYQNFAVTQQGIQLTNPGEQPGFVSMVNFLPDRMQIREELSGAHVDDFGERLELVTSKAIARLKMPVLVAQQHVVRSLITPRHFGDSREFLANAVCGFPAEAFAPFERPVGLYGVKMIFPNVENEPNMHTLRIESFNQDPRCVFLENVATFTQAVMTGQIDQLSNNMQATYRFLRDRALAFLARYDQAAPSES